MAKVDEFAIANFHYWRALMRRQRFDSRQYYRFPIPIGSFVPPRQAFCGRSLLRSYGL